MDAQSRKLQLDKVWTDISANFPDVPVMSVKQLNERIKSTDPKLVIVDTRSLDEMKVSVLPGPVVSKEECESKLEQYKADQTEVVCYCTAGMRSGRYAQELRGKGVAAFNLEGSMLEWTHQQLPLVELEDKSKETKRVHVYSKTWALHGEGYEAVMFGQGWGRGIANWAWGAVTHFWPGKK